MKSEAAIIAITPARGGSKGVSRKNVKPLGGKPLIYYTLKEAQKSRYISQVMVSTEDEEIAECKEQFNINTKNKKHHMYSVFRTEEVFFISFFSI